ncbi:MAG: PP2C family protein-serine/threonine phosphatase [Desulfobacula sp.]|uniref:PP2C family protein-serine/threonine phosphatase n=1 Tax=Desulfobacula sp. TaxID=2593537 RepID=UPI0025C55A83|nr:PP2C family protein-serine/threonine phosphatase [Desulfobacula sp.]MCD4721645.1 PP2C family protein-serine/threonine phosphatase [Desulfobacula sp.]
MKKEDDHKDITWVKVGKYLGRMSLFVQILANLTGALFVTLYFMFFDNTSIIYTSLADELLVPMVMTVFLIFIGVTVYRKWFRDIDRYIKLKSMRRHTESALLKTVQRKILNLPFAASMTSLFNWGLASIIMSSMVLFDNGFSNLTTDIWFHVLRTFAGTIIGGIVTVAMIFFIMENFCRKIMPYFFPTGGLVKIKGVFRLSLRLRIMTTFVFASFIPITDLALLSYSKAKEMVGTDPEIILSSLGNLIIFILFVDLSLAMILSHLLSRIIVKPVTEMKNAMEQVEKGNLAASVKVSDNNELGILADNFNKMTEGLRDRYQIKQSLALAGEVQQGLLPEKEPEIEGLDIAGRIIYSDETGGDYYDYIYPTDPAGKKIGIVVGDVSEHGISSALLMASTRAFMRQRVALPGSLASIVNDVNFQFSRDVEDSGRFITLFFLSVEYGKNTLEWVRAGHEPAIFYDSLTDSFEELKGKGIALGIDGDFQYTEYERRGFKAGQMVILETDGLWEARNSKGEMFGKERIRKILKENNAETAREILDNIMESVENYTGSKIPEDDMTLVIVKRK